MSSIEVVEYRARVELEPDYWGDYTASSIKQLRSAVIAVCRAVGTPEALKLAEDCKGDSK